MRAACLSIVLAFTASDLRFAFHDSTEIEFLERRGQLAHTTGRGIPFRQPDEIIDKPDERSLNGAEGGGNLHDPSERKAPVQIFRGDQEEGQDRKQRAIRVLDNGDKALLPNDPEPGPDDAGIGLAHRNKLAGIALDQGDALGILA